MFKIANCSSFYVLIGGQIWSLRATNKEDEEEQEEEDEDEDDDDGGDNNSDGGDNGGGSDNGGVGDNGGGGDNGDEVTPPSKRHKKECGSSGTNDLD